MKLKLTGMGRLQKRFDSFILDQKKRIADVRREVAKELIDAMLSNIPVWSGRTAASVQASNGSVLPVAPHPDRGGTSSDGFFRYHQEFGRTSVMRMGVEPRRAPAEAIARASIAHTDFSLDQIVIVTAGSTAWGKVEQGEAPTPEAARNVGVVSALALAQVRAAFRGQVK